MIQETFDCLLTRAYFMNNDEDEILESIDSKETFDSIIYRASCLMQEEDFFLIKDEYQNKLRRLIGEFRFEYNDSSINEDINYIIGRLNDYKNMSQERKNYLIEQFYNGQYAIRNLPRPYQVRSNIDTFMRIDFSTLIQLFPNIKGTESVELSCEILNDVEYISFINMLLNKHTDIFFLPTFIDTTVGNLAELSHEPNVPLYTLFYIKKTIKNIKKLERGKYKVITLQ